MHLSRGLYKMAACSLNC